MAKKPSPKPSPEPTLKTVLRKYILDIGELGKEMKTPEVEFGYSFFYPKGKIIEKGKTKYLGRIFQAFKPKKQDIIVINHKTNISPNHVKLIEANPKLKKEIYTDIIKMFLIKNVEYNINRVDNFFFISSQIFLEDLDYLSMNQFYKTVRNLVSTDIYSVVIINEKCSGKVKGKDFDSPYHI